MTPKRNSAASQNGVTNPETINRIIRLLEKTECFRQLPLSLQGKIAQRFSPRHFKKNQVIYLEGEPAETVYLIENGWVKATRMSREGREQTLLVLGEGEIFGEIGVFGRFTNPGTVIALEDVDLFTIPGKTLIALTFQNPDLAMAVIQHQSKRALYFIGLVEDMTLRSVEARLANTLLKNAIQNGDKLTVPRRSWTTFDEMAVRLGTVRDVLSRALHTLENEHLIEIKRNEIIIHDPNRLKKRGNP